jgi:signal transduction histidine kinase
VIASAGARPPRRFRRRLTAAFVIVAAGSAGLVALVTYVLAREYRWRTLQATATEETRFALALAPLDLDAASFERFIDVYEVRSEAQVVVVAGDQVLSSSDLGVDDVPADLAELDEKPLLVEADLAGRPVLVSGAEARDGDRYYLFFSLEQLYDSLDELARAAALSWFGTLVVAGAIGSVVARRALRPLATTAATAEAIAGGDLDARLPAGSSDEVGVLASSFNHMADEVQQLISQLGKAAERERRFTADVAHELRTPLTGMAASAALLAEHLPDLPSDARRPADILVHDVERLRQLVTELLELAQLDAATDEPHLVALDVATAVTAIVDDADARRSADIRCEIPAGLRVQAEPFALRRILGNLIDNAVRHGGGTVTVRAQPDPASDRAVRIEVIDDGPGIRSEEMARIFQRFHKSDRSRSRGGSGLGLAIAHEHAVRQGGELAVDNEPDRGARFTLRLRRADRTNGPTHAPGPSGGPPADVPAAGR